MKEYRWKRALRTASSAWAFRAAVRYLKRHGVYDLVLQLASSHPSTGVGLIDYACLFEFVRRHRPKCFLECGTGASTHIIAEAMARFSLPKHQDIALVSMEEEKQWYEQAMERYPAKVSKFLRIIWSPVEFHNYGFVRGVVYRDVPDLPYDAVFVDGPAYRGTCDMDLIRVVERSDGPVRAVIDGRRTSVLAYSSLLGRDKVRSYHFGLSFVEPVTREDLLQSSKEQLRSICQRNIRTRHDSYIRLGLLSTAICLWPMRWSR